MTTTDEIVVAALLETMHDPDEEVRAAVASALATIRPRGAKIQEVIASLLEANGDPCQWVQEAAERAFLAVLEEGPKLIGE